MFNNKPTFVKASKVVEKWKELGPMSLITIEKELLTKGIAIDYSKPVEISEDNVNRKDT